MFKMTRVYLGVLQGLSEKVRMRRSIGEGSLMKVHRRRVAREGPWKKVQRRRSTREGPPEKRVYGRRGMLPKKWVVEIDG